MTVAADMRDEDFCLRKAAEYRAKAIKVTNHRSLKASFEAAARVYDARARENAAGKSGAAAKNPRTKLR